MSQVKTFLILYLIYIPAFNSQSFVELFFHNDTSRECCEGEKALVTFNTFDTKQQIQCKCVKNITKLVYVLVGAALPKTAEDLCKGSNCTDVIDQNKETNSSESIHNKTCSDMKCFPKCCPLHAVYDTVEHKCVTANNSAIVAALSQYLNEGFFVMLTGLYECEFVIADYVLPYLNGTSFDNNRSIILQDLKISYENYCIDNIFNSEDYVVRVCHQNLSICEDQKCIKKCCPDGTIYKGGECDYDFEHGMNFSTELNPNESFAVVQGHYCKNYIFEEHEGTYTFNETGTLQLYSEGKTHYFSPLEMSYCFEEDDSKEYKGRRLYFCFEDEEDSDRLEFKISRSVLPISCAFLALTVIGYLLVPEMRNLHGIILICYCKTMLVAFVVLAAVQFQPDIQKDEDCMRIGYFLMFSCLSTFMWLNVMCFDMWRTFVSLKVNGIHKKRKLLRRFVWYYVYASKIPAGITILTFLIQNYGESLPEYFKPIIPTIGIYKCFFERETNFVAYVTWFLLPLTFVFVSNLVLFIKTVLYCLKVKNGLEKMKNLETNKGEFKKAFFAHMDSARTVVKLFFVMGVTWIFESFAGFTISSGAKGAESVIEIILTTINSLQGVFIFIIFILNKNYINAFMKVFGLKQPRRTSQSTTTTDLTSTSVKLSERKLLNTK